MSNPNVCDDCLTKITPQDEQHVLNSKTPIPQSDLPSEQLSPSEGNPGSSESGYFGEQSPSAGESPSESPPSQGGGEVGGSGAESGGRGRRRGFGGGGGEY